MLTDDEVVSILEKAEVEQRTLETLWGQFSVAIRQAKSAAAWYTELRERINKLEAYHTSLQSEASTLEARKQDIDTQAEAHRAVLEGELDHIRQELIQERNNLVAARNDMADLQRRYAEKRTQLESEIAVLRDKLEAARAAFAEFKKNLGG